MESLTETGDHHQDQYTCTFHEDDRASAVLHNSCCWSLYGLQIRDACMDEDHNDNENDDDDDGYDDDETGTCAVPQWEQREAEGDSLAT